MRKSTSPVGLMAAGIIVGILVLAGCSDVLQEPSQALGSTGEGSCNYHH
jgi:hypothetical protein